MVKMEPIAQSSLVDRVVERLRHVIADGKLNAGDRLPSETDLAEQLQVSRSVLREAVSRLEAMGLLQVRRGRGMFVGDRGSLSSCVNLVRSAMALAPRELMQFAELRAAVECESARRSAEVASPEDLAELQTLCEQIDGDDHDDLDAIRLDFRFHRKLVEITCNELMLNVYDVIQEFVMAGMLTTTPRPRNRERSRRLHGGILEAVRSGDPDAAEAAVRNHMRGVANALDEAEERRTRAARTPA